MLKYYSCTRFFKPVRINCFFSFIGRNEGVFLKRFMEISLELGITFWNFQRVMSSSSDNSINRVRNTPSFFPVKEKEQVLIWGQPTLAKFCILRRFWYAWFKYHIYQLQIKKVTSLKNVSVLFFFSPLCIRCTPFPFP